MAVSRQQVIQTAEKLVARGRLEAAIEEYRKVLEASPNDTSTLNRVGDLYARLNKVNRATDLFRQTAENFSRQGFFVKAIAIYKKIIRLDPSQIAAYESLADLYHKQGLANDAVAQYQVVADYYAKHSDKRSALAVYRQMVAIEPANPSYRLRLAGLYRDVGEPAGALEQYHEIATLMIEHGRVDEATQVYASAFDVCSLTPEYLARAVRALRAAGHPFGGERLLRFAADRQPSLAGAVRGLLARDAEAAVETPAPLPSWLTEEEPAPAAAAPSEPVPIEAEEAAPAAPAPGAEAEAESVAAPAVESVAEEEEEEEELVLDLDAAVLGEERVAELLQEAEASLAEPPTDAPAALAPAIEAASDFAFQLDGDAGEVVEALQPAAEAPEVTALPTGELEPELEPEAEPEVREPEVEVAEVAANAPEAAAEVAETAAAVEPRAPAAAPRPLLTIDARPLETALRIDRLLLDAEVLTRYEMEELAVGCLEQILDLDPDHVEAMGRVIDLELTLGRRDEALAMANRFASLAERSGQPVVWDRVVERMEGQGFRLEGGRFVGPPPAAVEPAAAEPAAAAEPEAAALEELIFEDLLAARRQERAIREEALLDAGELAAAAAPAAAGEAPAGDGSPPAAEPGPASLAAELLAELAAATGEAPAEPAAAAEEPLPWLARETVGSKEFFDLATELEAELLGEDLGDDLLPPVQEQTIEEIVEGFRRGMEKSLSPEDFDTHYNLGIAYQEMGLVDEAIGEFQLAAKDPRYLVECCSLLAACFQDKGYPELAVHWYERGLESPSLREEERLGLLYELGNLELALDERESARRRFIDIYGANSNYRDVVAKLEELGRPPL